MPRNRQISKTAEEQRAIRNRRWLFGGFLADSALAEISLQTVRHSAGFHASHESSAFWAYASHASNVEFTGVIAGAAAASTYLIIERFKRSGPPTRRTVVAAGAVAVGVGAAINGAYETQIGQTYVAKPYLIQSVGTPDLNDFWWGVIGDTAAAAVVLGGVRTGQPRPTDFAPDPLMPLEPFD